jgi:hypothetical protein
VSVHRMWFGLRRRVTCDACGEVILGDPIRLCVNCAGRDRLAARPWQYMRGWDQQRERYRRCALCRTAIMARSTAQDFCYGCYCQHPDASHGWASPPAECVRSHSCTRCGGLQLVIPLAEAAVEYRYYRVGTQNYSSIPYLCTGEVTTSDKSSCLHDWVIVHSTAIREPTMRYDEAKWIQSLMTESDAFAEALMFGRTIFWCCRCGLHMRLPPTREQMRPTLGFDGIGQRRE